jgi:hypothetical protein
MTCIKSLFLVKQSYCKCYDEVKTRSFDVNLFPFSYMYLYKGSSFSNAESPDYLTNAIYYFVLRVVLICIRNNAIFHTYFTSADMTYFKWSI